MRFKTLADWLRWQEGLHPQAIELGLERIKQVFQRLHPESTPFKVVTVAGTNGKGSTVTMLESVYQAAGYQTGAYSSPHLLRYNERIHVNGEEATDEQICQAFQRVDDAREDVSLTYFEFGTLAALDLFYQSQLDIVLLEVGLGGRLDAVNIIDSDVAVITSIGLDHTDWLGDDRESIAREKAGIMRAVRPIICSELDIPQTIFSDAARIGSELYCLGRDFRYEHTENHWSWFGPDDKPHALPLPVLKGEHQLRNASAVMMVLSCLAESFPVSYEHVSKALHNARPCGRQQVIDAQFCWMYDVAHNEQSIAALRDNLRLTPATRTHAVVGMLIDKDIQSSLETILPQLTDLYCVDLQVPRGASAKELQNTLQKLSSDIRIQCFPNVREAMETAEKQAGPADKLLVFGSFYTVAEALQRGV